MELHDLTEMMINDQFIFARGLSSFGDPNDTARGWAPVKNGTTDGFFFMRGVPLDPATIQARRDECTYMAKILKREAAIVEYAKEKRKRSSMKIRE